MKHLIKRLIAMSVLACATWNVQAQCPDPDTVTNNTVTLITATTARVNGTQATPTANQTIVLRYVRSGFTDTVSATGSGVMRNLTGLSPSTLYKYYYRTLCSDGRTDNQASYYTFTTLTSTVLYVAERPTVFQYLKTDTGGIAFVPSDTLEWRTPTDLAIIKYKSSNSTFYGYYPSCLCWRPLATDSAGIIAQLDLKVDSVTVSGDSLFWWNDHGVSHGYILPALNNVWKLQGNLATDTSADFLGTTDALPVKFKINGLNAGMIGFNSTSLGYGALPPNATTGGTGIGVGALSNNTGINNTAVGEGSAGANTTGTYNVGLGYRALYTNPTGLGNTALGAQALYTATNGLNTAIGKDAMYNNTTGSANVALGYAAGKYNTTLSNRLYINGVDQSNLAGDTTVSLVYGTFSSSNTYTSQRFKINGRLEVRDGTQSAGYIAVSDANGRSTWTNPTSIVTATPTLQQVTTAGNTTTDDITFSSAYPSRNSLTWTSNGGTDYGQLTYAGNTGNYTWTLPNANGIIPISVNGNAANSSGAIVISSGAGSGTVTGTGTQNYVTKWNNAGGTAIGNSQIFDNGTNVGINNTNTTYRFDVTGTANVSSNATIGGTLGVTGVATMSSNLNVTGNIRAGGGNYIYWDSRAAMTSPADGVIQFWNDANTGFTRTNYGGSTSSFPAIARNGTGIDIKLADNSAYTNLTALTLTGNTSVTSPLLIGGTATTSSLTYKTTTGVGTTGADHIFQVGNNGATEAMRILNNGNVGIGTSSPASVGLLDLTSTTKGFLPPRMTTAQRTAITAIEGLIIYDTDLHKLYVYDGTTWQACW